MGCCSDSRDMISVLRCSISSAKIELISWIEGFSSSNEEFPCWVPVAAAVVAAAGVHLDVAKKESVRAVESSI